MKSEKISIKGMSCGHCVMAVKRGLSKLPVVVKDVQVGSAEVEYDESKVSRQTIVETIEDSGYSVE
ncbi:MAG: cation transporter [Bacteroidota bacterium]|nr:cation transporter [Bacteroidota bacterium]MDP4197282.1 cation transporter [Bacteroidota bacterium]